MSRWETAGQFKRSCIDIKQAPICSQFDDVITAGGVLSHAIGFTEKNRTRGGRRYYHPGCRPVQYSNQTRLRDAFARCCFRIHLGMAGAPPPARKGRDVGEARSRRVLDAGNIAFGRLLCITLRELSYFRPQVCAAAWDVTCPERCVLFQSFLRAHFTCFRNKF